MAAFEQKINSATLFTNDKKEKQTHPDYRGTANVKGEIFYINAWVKESKNGKKYLSISFNPKDGLTNDVTLNAFKEKGGLSSNVEFLKQQSDDLPF